MPMHVGEIEALFRYPVKSMAGERLDAADLGWFGLDGDRRLALRRLREGGGFPWLSASRLPELLAHVPLRADGVRDGLPTHARTPDGRELELFGPELAAEIAGRLGSPVEMMHLDRGIFDEANLSVIAASTVDEVARLSDHEPDVRRFRPNILIRTHRAVPFEEDEWVGGVLSFGDEPEAPCATVTNRDERCAMVNFDPETAAATPAILKAIVRERDNKAGVYASVTRRGRLRVGQRVWFVPATGHR